MMDLKAYLKTQAEQAQGAVDQYDADLAAARNEGIEAGRDQVPAEGSTEKLYTQEEVTQLKKDMAAKIRNADLDNEALAADLEKDDAAPAPEQPAPTEG